MLQTVQDPAVEAAPEQRGARACVLQVSADNAAALALYERLGFRQHHRYRYWVPCEDRTR